MTVAKSKAGPIKGYVFDRVEDRFCEIFVPAPYAGKQLTDWLDALPRDHEIVFCAARSVRLQRLLLVIDFVREVIKRSYSGDIHVWRRKADDALILPKIREKLQRDLEKVAELNRSVARGRIEITNKTARVKTGKSRRTAGNGNAATD